MSQSNGLGHELSPGGWKAGKPRKRGKNELQTEQKEEALGQLLCPLEDAGSCGNGAQSGKWLAKAGSAGIYQPSLPPRPQWLGRSWIPAVSFLPGRASICSQGRQKTVCVTGVPVRASLGNKQCSLRCMLWFSVSFTYPGASGVPLEVGTGVCMSRASKPDRKGMSEPARGAESGLGLTWTQE